MKKVLIVGAGLSGCTIARLLKDTGLFDVHMIEKSGSIGGNCKDYIDQYGNIISEYGPHIFHTNDSKIINFINRFSPLYYNFNHRVKASFSYLESSASSAVELPINLNNVKLLISIFENEKIAKDVQDFLYDYKSYSGKSKLTLKNLSELQRKEAKILYKVLIDYIYNPYSCKQWGVNDISKINNKILDRVPIYLDEKNSYFRDDFQVYPKIGYSNMMANMIKDIPLLLSIPFEEYLELNKLSTYDLIIYTGSIDELFKYALGRLPYRGVYFKVSYNSESLKYPLNNSFVVNYPSPAFKYTRIANYKFLNAKINPEALHENAPIIKEYPMDALVNNRSYPIGDGQISRGYKDYLDLAKSKYPNMMFLGRLGTYKYLDMDKAIDQAFDLFNKIMKDMNKICIK
ncbi:TPA: NAD(P)-binding protein [Campylobacter coli]|nr:NAD(P)-binding protein [Campylobacter coli]